MSSTGRNLSRRAVDVRRRRAVTLTEQKIPASAVAARLGVDLRTVYRYLADARNPRPDRRRAS